MKERVLLINDKSKTEELYGKKGLNDIEKVIEEWGKLLLKENIFVHRVYVDKVLGKNKRRTPEKIRKIVINEYMSKKFDYLVILGDHYVIPYFKLKDRTFDDDYILSDNPYGSLDDDFLVPEIPVSRIPTPMARPEFVINYFKNAKGLHKQKRDFVKSFGYSAPVWEKASREVYRRIGNPKDLILSPPKSYMDVDRTLYGDADILYFNLHGSKTSKYFYGQKGNQYPKAFSPENWDSCSIKGSFAASEACYGGFTEKKPIEESIALMFLYRGGGCYMGSTSIAYGPSTSPSSEADLLVKYFFDYTLTGMNAGFSFMNAKRDFAKKMIRRQGYLDEDDEKTLLEFVLFGDPTLRLEV